MKNKVVIVDHREEGFEMEKKAFASYDAELMICQCSDEDDLIKTVSDAQVIIFTSSKINAKVISRLKNCRMIIRYGIGLDNIDIKAASERGIYVCNTPEYGTFAVAEHAFALMLGLNRKLILLDHNVRNHIWGLESIIPVHSLRFKILGIVGFGNIGRHVSKMALSFDMKVIINDPYINNETAKEYNVDSVSFDDLILNSDHISVHVPLNRETKHLFDENVFRRMKKNATIINTSRGDVINQDELIEALRSGQIAGAGLDVFPDEPVHQDNELLTMNNVILSPHVAWYSEESIINLHREVVDNVTKVLRGEKPLNIVNDTSITKKIEI
jgi:D-3-phosphoglycerate dehydrogenase